MVSELGIRIEMDQEVGAAFIEDAKPDVVILAIGVKPFIPQIPGIDRSNVITADDVLADKAAVGDRAAVIGAELVGCETAEFLADKGKGVTIMRRGEEVATKVNPRSRELLLTRLSAKGITLLTGVCYQKITDKIPLNPLL